MNVKRIKAIATLLEQLPSNKKFNMSRWTSCGTASCAIGYACEHEWFDIKLRGNFSVPFYNNEFNYSAVVEYLEIAREYVHHLFNPEHYDIVKLHDKLHVAKRIRKFLKENGVEDWNEQIDLTTEKDLEKVRKMFPIKVPKELEVA